MPRRPAGPRLVRLGWARAPAWGASMSGGEPNNPSQAEPWPGAMPPAAGVEPPSGRPLSDQDLTELAVELARDAQHLRAEAAALRAALRMVLEALEPLEVSPAMQPALADGIYRAWLAAKEGLAAADRVAGHTGDPPSLPPRP